MKYILLLIPFFTFAQIKINDHITIPDDALHFWVAFEISETSYQIQSKFFPKMPEVRKVVFSNIATFGCIVIKERIDMVKKHPTGWSWDDFLVGSWSIPVYDIFNTCRYDWNHRNDDLINSGYFEFTPVKKDSATDSIYVNENPYLSPKTDTMAKTTNTKTSLTLLDRMLLPALFSGKEANSLVIRVIKDLKKKVEITQAEIKKFDIKVNPNGSISYNQAGINSVLRIDFTDLERDQIKKELQKKDEENKLTEEFLDLYDKFVKK